MAWACHFCHTHTHTANSRSLGNFNSLFLMHPEWLRRMSTVHNTMLAPKRMPIETISPIQLQCTHYLCVLQFIAICCAYHNCCGRVRYTVSSHIVFRILCIVRVKLGTIHVGVREYCSQHLFVKCCLF